jgi:predicted aspartyl protease
MAEFCINSVSGDSQSRHSNDTKLRSDRVTFSSIKEPAMIDKPTPVGPKFLRQVRQLTLSVAAMMMACCLPAQAAPAEAMLLQAELRQVGPHGMVEMRIAGLDRPLRMLIDTAATHTMFDQSVAEQLKLEQAPDVALPPIQGATGMMQAPRQLKPVTLSMGTGSIVVAPLVHDFSPMYGGKTPPHDGILGMDVMLRYDLKIDMPKQQFSLATPGSMPAWFESKQQCSPNLNAKLKPESPFAFVQIRAEKPDSQALLELNVLVDTGASKTTLNRQAAQALGFSEGDARLRKREGGIKGAGGQVMDVFQTKLPSLRVGERTIAEPEVLILAAPKFKALNLDMPAAVLGFDVMRQMPVAISSNSKTVCLG